MLGSRSEAMWQNTDRNVCYLFIETQNKHKEEFEDCDKAEKARGANSTRTGRKSQAPSSQLQETIESTINTPRYYNTESFRQTAITRKLAIFIEATNVPFYLVKYLIEKEFLKRSA